MTPKDPGWVKGKIPARVPQAQSQLAQGSAEAARRVARIKQRQMVGASLAETLRQRSPYSLTSPAQRYRLVGGATIVMAIALAAASIVTGETLWLLAGAGTGLAAAAAFFVSRQKPTDTSMHGLIIEAENLDQVLEQFAASLPKEAVAVLARIKEALALILAGNSWKDGSTLSLEDGLFARELVARYIPDACRHYCELKAAARSPVQLSGERTAEDSLIDQLSIMNERLERILQAIVAGKADKLVHHEHFIRLKR